MKRGVLYGLPLVLASLGLWYAASMHRTSADSLPTLIEQAPVGATMIAYADLAALRQSPWIQQLEALAQPAQVDPDYTTFVDSTGFDYQRDLDRVMIATTGAASDLTTVFAEGRFNRQKIEQYALRSGKLQQESGRDVYVVPSTTPGKNIRLTFLSDIRIAISSGGALSSLVAASSASTLDAAMRERLSRVAGAPIFAAIKGSTLMRTPATADSDVKTGVGAQLQSLRWIAFAAQPNASDILLSAEGECDRPEDAQRVAGTLELMRALFHGAMADPKTRGQMPAASAAAVGKLLDAAKITTETVRVRLLVSLTPEMLRLPAPGVPAKK